MVVYCYCLFFIVSVCVRDPSRGEPSTNSALSLPFSPFLVPAGSFLVFKKNNDNVKQSRSANSVRGVQRSSDCNGDTNLNRKVSDNSPKSVIHASERALQSYECTRARVEIPTSPSQEACLQHTQEKWVTNEDCSTLGNLFSFSIG